MTPIQVWLPLIQGGVARPELRRDLQRAFRAWHGENVVWTVPGWRGPQGWKQGPTSVRCVPSENHECFRIIHVGSNGAVVGPAAAAFPNRSVTGLLDAWLNTEAHAVPEQGGREVPVPIPHAVEGGVAYAPVPFRGHASSIFPFAHVDEDTQAVRSQWPPERDAPAPVSPELEAAETGKPGEVPSGTNPVRTVWPSPFDGLTPAWTSPDDQFAHAQIRRIAALSSENLAEARSQAETEAREWLSTGESTVYKAWFEPIFVADGDQNALADAQTRYGLPEVLSLADAYQREDWRAVLRRPMPVRRALGIPGPMWALLHDRLSSELPFQSCEMCGQLLSGRSLKRFCGPEDNVDCYRKRKRKDRQHARRVTRYRSVG